MLSPSTALVADSRGVKRHANHGLSSASAIGRDRPRWPTSRDLVGAWLAGRQRDEAPRGASSALVGPRRGLRADLGQVVEDAEGILIQGGGAAVAAPPAAHQATLLQEEVHRDVDLRPGC